MPGTKSAHKGYRQLLADTTTATRTMPCGTCGEPRTVGRKCQTCSPSPVRDTDEIVASVQRQIRALEERAMDDPAVLAQIIMLAQRLAEIPNVVIAVSSDSYKADQMAAPSMQEIARLLGMKPQSAHDRLKIGERIIEDRLSAAGVQTMTAAKRERTAREAAAKHAAETMPEWATRRAAMRVVA